MKNKILTISFSLISTLVFAQEVKKETYEKFKFGLGAEVMTYVGIPVSTYGYKLEAQLPIYKRLSSNFSFVEQSSYFDYCDEIPVSVTEKHFVYGLNYTFYNNKKWSIGAMLSFDTEFTRYKEQDDLPENASVFHREGAHQDDHSYQESYTEGLAGLEVNYLLSDRFMLNASSRINTYGSFRNSVSLFYVFDFKKTNK